VQNWNLHHPVLGSPGYGCSNQTLVVNFETRYMPAKFFSRGLAQSHGRVARVSQQPPPSPILQLPTGSRQEVGLHQITQLPVGRGVPLPRRISSARRRPSSPPRRRLDRLPPRLLTSSTSYLAVEVRPAPDIGSPLPLHRTSPCLLPTSHAPTPDQVLERC